MQSPLEREGMVDIRTGVPAPVEYPITIHRNDVEYVTVQATPADLEDLALGLLYSEGVIRGPGEVSRIVADSDRGLVWVELNGAAGDGDGAADPSGAGEPPLLGAAGERGVAPAGAAQLPPVPAGVRVTEADLARFVTLMLKDAVLYQQTRGCHSAMAVRPDTGERLVREDIGRHNAVDKVIGAALKRGWAGPQLVVCTSGRISYEMCAKLARFGVGIVASHTAATDLACDLADRLGMDLVGYVRTPHRQRLYTAGLRLLRTGE